jgi:hypothetical protein
VHHRTFPTLAGDLPRRRRIGLRRVPSIQHVFIKLMARTRSSRLTGSRAQVGCRRSSPEHPRRRWPLRRRLGSSSESLFPAVPTLDTWRIRTLVSSCSFPSPQTSSPVITVAGTRPPPLCSVRFPAQGPRVRRKGNPGG